MILYKDAMNEDIILKDKSNVWIYRFLTFFYIQKKEVRTREHLNFSFYSQEKSIRFSKIFNFCF